MSVSLWFLAVSDMLKTEALLSFLLLAVRGTFPLAGALCAYLAGFALNLLLRRRRLPLYMHVLTHLVGGGIAAVLLEAWSFGVALSFGALAGAARANPVLFISMLLAVLIFWGRGLWLSVRAKTHEFAVLRFDEGLAIFLCVFFFAAFLHVRATIAEQLVIPYFAFSMIALGLSKNEHARKGGLSPATTRRVLVPVIAVVALVAVGIFFLIPALTEPARSAAAALKSGGLTLLSYIAAILKWLFGDRKVAFRAEDSGARQPQERQFQEQGESVFGTIMMYVFGTLVILVVLALLAFLAVSVWRFLKRQVGGERQDKAKKNGGFGEWFARLIVGVRRIFGALRAALAKLFASHSEAVRAFLRMRSAGRAAGLVQKRSETAREYATRLAARFPAETTSTELVVSALEREVYGGEAPDQETRRALSGAARHFRRYSLVAESLRHKTPRFRR